ncbi:hypothetical protein CYMTET_7110 [Cymbomonas tetramitiformis]|uniref:Uncharacterized protein n=1 Tax=Cymbomonas tetramitiformis TaxID=36881 RepID=A0AAE0LHS4_9CHLO|nr:hypothetical protein CYMTET_7110 [Cymbomonas tetramitiformis]
MVQAASQRLGNIADEPDSDIECMPLDETAKLKEEALKEEGNLRKAAHAKELAEVSADLDDLIDDDSDDKQPTLLKPALILSRQRYQKVMHLLEETPPPKRKEKTQHE